MIEIAKNVGNTERLAAWLERLVRPQLQADVSKYAKGRLRAWLNIEPTLSTPTRLLPHSLQKSRYMTHYDPNASTDFLNWLLNCYRPEGLRKPKPYAYAICGGPEDGYYLGRRWNVRDERKRLVCYIVAVTKVTEAEYHDYIYRRFREEKRNLMT